jgi:predicted nucleotidyltransferase
MLRLVDSLDPYVLAWRARFARDEALARQRACEATEVARALARVLAARFSVTRVALFGSAARGSLSPRADIDLAVWGLAADAYLDALVAVHEGHGFEVDLVPYERAHPHIREAIDHDGVVLHDSAGGHE